FGLSRQQVVGKRPFVVLEAECPVPYQLIAHGSAGYRAEYLTTGGSGTVSRPYLHIGGKAAEFRQRLEQLVCADVLCTHQSCRFFQQVRTTDVAHEDKIAREEHDRLIRGRMITQ